MFTLFDCNGPYTFHHVEPTEVLDVIVPAGAMRARLKQPEAYVAQARSANSGLGRVMADMALNILGPNGGSFAILSASPDAANQNAWIAAFRNEMKKHPNIQIIDEVYGYDNEQKAFDLTVALTTKYPDLGGLYAPTCPGLPAVARALESVNKGHGAIKLAGLCVPSITAKYMLDGTIQVFYLWDPIKLGYITYYAAKNFAEGRIQGKPGESFTIPERKWPGTYTIQPKHAIVTGQPLQFTPENLKEYDYDIDKMPWVLQFNKRDLPTAVAAAEMYKQLNFKGEPTYEAIATNGTGVFDTLKAVAKLVLTELKKK